MPPLTRVGSPALTVEQLLEILYTPLAQVNRYLASGVPIRDAPQATPLKIPKLTEFSASDYYSEGEEIADSDAPTDYLTLLPPTLRSIKTWLPLSSEVIRNSPLALESNMRDQLIFSVNRKLETEFFKGTGTPIATGPHAGDHGMVGVLNWAGTQKTDMAGVAPTLDDFANMITDVESAFAVPRVFFMTPKMWGHVRLMKDTLERPLLNPQPSGETGKSLWGVPVQTSAHLAEATGNESSVILADTEQMIVARDLSPEARIFDQTLAKTDELAIRVVTRMDTGSIWPQGIAILENATHIVP